MNRRHQVMAWSNKPYETCSRSTQGRSSRSADDESKRTPIMKRYLLILTVIQGMGLTSIASAESAWVLWSQQFFHSREVGSRTTWEVLNAYRDRESCLKAASNYITLLEDHNKTQDDVKTSKQEYVGRTRLFIEAVDRSYSSHISGVCLPEMIDPRPRFRE